MVLSFDFGKLCFLSFIFQWIDFYLFRGINVFSFSVLGKSLTNEDSLPYAIPVSRKIRKLNRTKLFWYFMHFSLMRSSILV